MRGYAQIRRSTAGFRPEGLLRLFTELNLDFSECMNLYERVKVESEQMAKLVEVMESAQSRVTAPLLLSTQGTLMHTRTFTSSLVGACLALAAVAAQAQTPANFATLDKAPAVALTADQMANIEGKAHIYLLVESRGVELPAQGEAATRAAAPTPMGGDFARSPSREATAFNFLN